MTENEKWERVVNEISRELDPQKRRDLVGKLHSALDKRAQTIRSTWLRQNRFEVSRTSRKRKDAA